MFLDSTDAAALYPGRGPAIETASQSGGLISFKKKILIGYIYRKTCSGVKSDYGRFLNLTKKFINNIHQSEINEDITSIPLRPLK